MVVDGRGGEHTHGRFPERDPQVGMLGGGSRDLAPLDPGRVPSPDPPATVGAATRRSPVRERGSVTDTTSPVQPPETLERVVIRFEIGRAHV